MRARNSRDSRSLKLHGFSLRGIKRRLRLALSWSLLGTSLLGVGACSRASYRYKTNREAYSLIDEKIVDSHEQVQTPYRIEVDPKSRFYDPFNPDRPPMPEDDPDANRYMHLVDKKKGYPLWEANGRTNTAENPEWWQCLPLDERGVLVLDLNEAVRQALLHSTAYQQAKETLFLSALDVSSERFLFDSQFFGGWQSNASTSGRLRPGNGGQSQTTISTGPFSRGQRPLSMQKQYTNGANLVVGLANTMSWQVVGSNDHSATTLLDFALVQPLLRQGGRDVVLERLTLAERTLLSNIRAFERYRRGFYLQIATGRQAEQGPARRGGVFGGAGLQGFTGLGGGFGTLGGGGNANQGFAGNNNAPGAGGYLGLLQQQLTIVNLRENILRQTDNLLRLEETYRELILTIPASQATIPTQQLQVAQQQQAVFTAQTNLLSTNSNYQQQLDTFKRQMGLPPYLCVEIRDPLLDKLNLISDDLRRRRDELNTLRSNFGNVNSQILNLSRTESEEDSTEEFRAISDSAELTKQLGALRETLKPLQETQRKLISEDLQMIKKDVEQLIAVMPERKTQLERLKAMVSQEKNMICGLIPLDDFDDRVLDTSQIDSLPNELNSDIERLAKRFQSAAERTAKLDEDIEKLTKEIKDEKSDKKRFEMISQRAVLRSQDLVSSMAEDVLALQLVQARARTEAAMLPEVDLDPREALEIARTNRRDWLNNRNALVNSWRAIELVADDLESFLDFTFTGDVQNVGDNPLALRSATGRLRMGLQWDAPITRLQERNRYRQSLVEYQQAKRSYFQFEDGIWLSLRTSLRSIRQNQLSFELQRYAVRNAAKQVSINEDIRQINETLSQASGPTAARDAVSALGDLLTSQNLLIGVWVNYEALRRNLDLDLETMELDADGLWIDPGPMRADTVGGRLGESILNYGLTPEQIQAAQQLQVMESQPVELAPTNTVPSDAQNVRPPANELPKKPDATPLVPKPEAAQPGLDAGTQAPPYVPLPQSNNFRLPDKNVQASGEVPLAPTNNLVPFDQLGLPRVPDNVPELSSNRSSRANR